MLTLFRGARLQCLLVLSLFIAQGAWAADYARIQNPLNEKRLVLTFHRERIAGEKGTFELVMQCQSQSESSTTLKNCPVIQLLRVFHPDRRQVPQEDVLGHLDRQKLPALFNELISNYDASYNASPLILATASGVIVGVAMGELGWAVTLGTLGFMIDLAKAPVMLPYTAISKLHRMAQRKKLRNRFDHLLANKKFKVTRMLGNHQFHAMANRVLEFCATNPVSVSRN